MGIFSIFSKKEKQALDQGLAKTKSSLLTKLSKAITGKAIIDSEVLDEVEETLITADVGVETTLKIIGQLERRVAKDKYLNTDELYGILKEEIIALLAGSNAKEITGLSGLFTTGARPYVILVVGVNGVGKTTTIGKLAALFKHHNHKVVLGAADTFRAAAVEQISQWGKKIDVPVVSHGMHTDPSSVAYDAVKQAVEMQADVVLIDTAGRLHNKVGLMNELTKIRRVVQKFIPEAPHEVLLVLDGSTGQNAFLQAEAFTKATDVTALAVTKLDGSAKGGVVLGISAQFNIPVKYIGVGEGIDDLQVFDKKAFVTAPV